VWVEVKSSSQGGADAYRIASIEEKKKKKVAFCVVRTLRSFSCFPFK